MSFPPSPFPLLSAPLEPSLIMRSAVVVGGRTLAGLGLGETIGLRLRPFLAVLHPTRRRCWNSFFARGRGGRTHGGPRFHSQ